METPLRPVRRAGHWLRRLAGFALLGGGIVGCAPFVDTTTQTDKMRGTTIAQAPVDPNKKPVSDPNVVQAKSDGPLIDWSDWEWQDFDVFGIFPKPAPAAPIPDAIVLRGDGLTPVKAPAPGDVETKMALARERFAAKDYVRAEKIFHRIGDNEKNPPRLVQEALHCEAECLYFQDIWPKAASTYMNLMNKFPRNKYRDDVLARMFDIADFWLEDTRLAMRESKEKVDGQRWFVAPHFVNWDKKKPLLDEEGRAIQLLEAVRFGELNSPRADQALYLCGSVKFFDEDYKDADYYFTQLSQKRNTHSAQGDKMYENATRLAIIAKHLSTGGPDYDGRKAAEARILIQESFEKYPNIDKTFLNNQIVSITTEQAEKDFRMAEFYERTGHPGAAVWQYELVIRRYHGMEPYASDAVKRRADILNKMETQGLAEPPPPGPHTPGPKLEQLPAPRPLPSDLGPGR